MLHVLNGDVVADTLARATVAGTRAVWADVLHEGPVPPDEDAGAWFDVRSRFIARCGWVDEETARAKFDAWQAPLDAFRACDEVVLWFEHDLFDQLLLIRHLAWFAARSRPDAGDGEIDGTRLSLICIGAYPGIEPFHGLGQLSADQLGGLLPGRVPVTRAQLELGRVAWQAFTAADPTALAQLAADDTKTSALPFLSAALLRLCEEYPSVRNGVGRTEQQILDILAEAPRDPGALFRENQRREPRVFMGDATFWLRLRALAGGSAPLVEILPQRSGAAANGDDAGGERSTSARAPAMWSGEVRITGTGRRVQAGDADHVELAGLDRWIGGVHLRHPDRVWRRDAEAGRLRLSRP